MPEIRLSTRRCEEIKKIVVKMFVKYGVSCVPINGFEIATKMGISIIPYSAYLLAKRILLLKKVKTAFPFKKQPVNGSFFTMMKRTITESTTQ